MENPFLDKVHQIILDHLDDENFGVNQLASEIGLSKSQTFRKVKSLTNKSVNQFIRETRLQEAAKLILKSDLHASEISYKVGFSSPSYFNKCFRKYYGITPGEYKENKKETSPVKGFEKASSSGIKKFQPLIYFIGTALLIYGIISLIKSKNSTYNTSPNEISIAVLYFDDHSPDSDKQWFCNSITEEITAKLAGIKRLMVTSRTSVKQYRSQDRSIPEIAEALGVDYIIEGSVTMGNDSVKIIAQLIKANNKHIWSKEYKDRFENYFSIQKNVAMQIANELNINLSPEEEKEIDYIPTNNLEAAQLFSEGISFMDLVGVEEVEGYRLVLPGGYTNLWIADSLFQRTIDLDPDFAEAYAEKAFIELIYYEKTPDSIAKVAFKKIDSLLDRSLEINPNTVRAHTTRGLKQGYRGGNWEKAKENFEKALEIKPNDAANQLYYALYFASRPEPDYKKALYHINIAQKLNPHSTTINYDKIEYLLKNDKLVEAEEFYKYHNSFFTEGLKSKIKIKLLKAKAKKISIEKKDWTEAISFYHEAIEKDPKNAGIYRLLAEGYDEILNDGPNFYKYAKLAFELDTTKTYIYKRSFMFSQGKNKKWKENFKSIQSGRHKAPLSTHYYMQGDYQKAQKYLDMHSYNNHLYQAIFFAQQNKLMETYEFLDSGILANFEKARVFAILKERDSMYFYINKEKDIYKIRYFNSYFEVDPYRKEERFKALLKKHYLPLTHWNK